MPLLLAKEIRRLSRAEAFAIEARMLERVAPALEFKMGDDGNEWVRFRNAMLRQRPEDRARRAVGAFFGVFAELQRAALGAIPLGAIASGANFDPMIQALRAPKPSARGNRALQAALCAADTLAGGGSYEYQVVNRGSTLADLHEIAAHTEAAFHAWAPHSAAEHAAEVARDYEWIMVRRPSSNQPSDFVGEPFFARPIWSAQIPGDWRPVVDEWSEWLVEIGAGDLASDYDEELVGYTFFISYAQEDRPFVDKLRAALDGKKIRYWYAPEAIPVGSVFPESIVENIQRSGHVLVVLSERSIQKPWVRREVEEALKVEKKRLTTRVLMPIKIDCAAEETNVNWVEKIRRSRHVGDFTAWNDAALFDQALALLLREVIY